MLEKARLAVLHAAARVAEISVRDGVEDDARDRLGLLEEDCLELVVLPLAYDALAVVHDDVDAGVARSDVAREEDFGSQRLADDVAAEPLHVVDLGYRLEARSVGDEVRAALEDAGEVGRGTCVEVVGELGTDRAGA